MQTSELSNKPYPEMTDAELAEQHKAWAQAVETAGGWASAYFAATQLAAICTEGHKRGSEMINPFPIKRG